MAQFQASLGDAASPGLADQATRLQRLVRGQNPYITGDALPPDAPVFFGRQRQLAETLGVLRRPEKPGSVSILGERRFGKSSFLNQVRQALSAEPGLITLHATTQDWSGSTPAIFFGGLRQAIRGALAGTEHAALIDAPPTSTPAPAEPSDASPAAEPPTDPCDYARLRDLIRPLAARGLRFVLLLDELEVIVDKPAFDADFFGNLRALGERPDYNFGYLIASRRPLKELCRDHRIEASSFWNIFGFPQYIGLLDADDAHALVREPLWHTLPPERLPDWQRLWKDAIAPLTGCHPGLMQLVLAEHWNALAGGYAPDPDRIGAGPA